MFHSNGPVTEGVPADITADRETNPQGVIMQLHQFNLTYSNQIKFLESLMLGDLLLAYLNTIEFEKNFSQQSF